MKQTHHNSPFDHVHGEDNLFWDFSWQNDKWTIFAVALMIVVCGVIYKVAF